MGFQEFNINAIQSVLNISLSNFPQLNYSYLYCYYILVTVSFTLDIVARRKKAATEMPDVDVKALEAAREVRLKEIQMEAILKEFITYFIFVSVVFFLSYQARDVASFDYAQNIKNTLVDNSPVNFQDGVSYASGHLHAL